VPWTFLVKGILVWRAIPSFKCLEMPRGRMRGCPLFIGLVCLLTGGPPSVGVGLPRDQADGVESSEGACGCDMAGYSIGLLPTRYVEEAKKLTKQQVKFA
jgi:hypothetical protein